MNNKKLIRLNNWLCLEFGRNDAGKQKIRWDHTSLLVRFRKLDQTDSGIYLVTPRFEKVSWAETPLGPCWILAMWHAPMGEDARNRDFQSQYPQFSGGTYYPIFGSQLPQGEEPNDYWTGLRITELRAQLDKTYADHLREGQEVIAASQQEKSKETQDMVDDAWPAFDNVPGEKWHVSFPTPESQKFQPTPNAE
jgi:hypothetical protein